MSAGLALSEGDWASVDMFHRDHADAAYLELPSDIRWGGSDQPITVTPNHCLIIADQREPPVEHRRASGPTCGAGRTADQHQRGR